MAGHAERPAARASGPPAGAPLAGGGLPEALAQDLRALLRLAAGRNEEPGAAIIDSRTLRSTPESGIRAGHDGAKRKEKGWTQDQAAQALGKPKSDISGTLRILVLPADVLHKVLTSEHPPAKNVLVEMARIEDPATLAHLVGQAQAGTLTVKAVRLGLSRPGRTPNECRTRVPGRSCQPGASSLALDASAA